jgi:hypothetical protein
VDIYLNLPTRGFVPREGNALDQDFRHESQMGDNFTSPIVSREEEDITKCLAVFIHITHCILNENLSMPILLHARVTTSH